MLRRLFIILLAAFLIAGMAGHQSFAQGKYSIKEMTPQVTEALENRRDRYEELANLKQEGLVGENNQGYIHVFEGRPDVEAIANAENRDRKIIYQTIAEQNGLVDAIGTIEEVFAQVQRDKAQAGDRIQSPDGSWMTK